MGKRIQLDVEYRPPIKVVIPSAEAQAVMAPAIVKLHAEVLKAIGLGAETVFTKGINSGGPQIDLTAPKRKRGRPKTQTAEQRKEYLKRKAKERRDRLRIA